MPGFASDHSLITRIDFRHLLSQILTMIFNGDMILAKNISKVLYVSVRELSTKPSDTSFHAFWCYSRPTSTIVPD